MGMLEEGLADAKQMENEVVNAEVDAQAFYENFMKDSNTSVEQSKKSIRNMSKHRANTKSALVGAKSDFDATMLELESLNTLLGTLHKDCDYVLDNFEARQEACAVEMDAL